MTARRPAPDKWGSTHADSDAPLVGQPLLRVEDERLLRGKGRYVADLHIPGTLQAVFLRSPHAHARIRSIDTAAALAAPGVRAIFTSSDTHGHTEPLCVSGDVHTPERLMRELKPIDRLHPIPMLPVERVTYVGQPVAVIVADTRNAALDAAELVVVEYETLPVVTDAKSALAPGAPLIEPSWGTNQALEVAITKGDPDRAFASAPVVVEEEFHAHRYAAAPIETRGVLADIEPHRGALTVWASTQMAHVMAGMIADCLRIPPETVRVVACDVGGGFGLKGVQTVEDILVPFAALRLGCPVRWIEDRSEHLTAAAHARDQVHRISAAATKDGRLIAIRDEVLVNFGAYNVIGLVVPYNTLSHLLGQYHVPNAYIRVQGILTNTSGTTPYRGAGRPEAVFAMERILDRLALKLGMDPADLREKNLVPASAMPYDTGLLYRDGQQQVYDSGDFPELMRRARQRIDLPAIRKRQAESAASRSRTRTGVGFALYIEGTGMGPFEGAVVQILPSGRVVIATGASSQGQGHRTVYAQIAADALGVHFSDVEIIGGDTATIPHGVGTIASRSTVTAGNAVHNASLAMRTRVLEIASDLLEAAAADLEIVDGRVRIAGVPDKGVTLGEVSVAMTNKVLRQGAPGDGRLIETSYFRPPTVTYASATHAVQVEVDIDTGVVRVERYVIAHDSGRIVNPLLADAQVVGGVMQGIGGAIKEAIVYDDAGQPIAGSFMDYAMPIASDGPEFILEHIESLSPRNPLGVKGLGEGGAIGPPAAVANAIEDALREFGVVVREGPLSPSRVRRLIEESPNFAKIA